MILSLDWIDLGGTLRQACGGELPRGKVIQCSVDQYVHNGWNMDYQALPPTDLSILAPPDALVAALLAALGAAPAKPATSWFVKRDGGREPEPRRAARQRRRLHAARRTRARDDRNARAAPSVVHPPAARLAGRISAASRIRWTTSASTAAAASARVRAWRSAPRWRCAAVDRLPVAVLGDGDYLMGLTALWTGVHYRVPVLIIVANNESFFNDELHQERMARLRGRPVENRWIGMRMSDPAIDLASSRAGRARIGYGPMRSADELAAAIAAGGRRRARAARSP